MLPVQPQLVLAPRPRRGYQDYRTWQSFFVLHQWQDMKSNPNQAIQIAAAGLSALQLEVPAETTSADVAAGVAVAMHGPVRAASLPAGECTMIYNMVKANYQN
jgi:hypothetical protein